ncbi:Uma2 family endonuclease [Geminocystis sp. CENA526]|uniref:Uma2 family endonuclease n=1 Tax=Geminocystis sp. CENA526 TaxID=1355871 RepID=UPI003D6F52D8
MTLTLNKPLKSNNLLVIPEITWTQLETIEASFQDLKGVRFSYLDGYLQIMNLSLEHEETKRIIGTLLEAYMRKKGIRFYMKGSATIGSHNIGGKKEPDESYNIHSKKDIPDLVIEIVVSSGGINTLELYRRIGVPEVWFWEDGLLKIYSLQESYILSEKSLLLPDLDINNLIKYATYYDQYDAVTNFLETIK